MTFKVNANVVDLQKDTPKVTDMFFVDTNVWYWFGYTQAKQDSQNYQITNYPLYVQNALSIGSTLYKCTLSFAELAHSIERSERRIFSKKLSLPSEMNPKKFRHDHPIQRGHVFTEIEGTWNLVNSVTGNNTIEVNVTENLVDESLKRLKNEALDGYDTFMIEAMLASGITQVITDDRDFGQVAGITVFTANNTLITEATAQRKLIQR